MDKLRAIVPRRIVRGALLREDGVAVGLVCGGAPRWDLLALASRAAVASDYHRLLLTLDAPLDIYLVDQPARIAEEVAFLQKRYEEAEHALQAAVVGELIDYLTDLAENNGSRAKQTIWAVSVSGGRRSVGGLDLSNLLRPRRSKAADATHESHQAALATALEKARRLADALAQLGGAPQPRIMEAEEIAAIVYQLADPVRAQRYPLAGTLLDRVRRIVTVPKTRSTA